MGFNGKLSMVKCKVFSSIEKINKLFVLKFDGLQKHDAWQKPIVAKLGVKVGKYFMSLNNQHAKKNDNLLQCMQEVLWLTMLILICTLKINQSFCNLW